MGIPLNIDWQQILLHLFNFLILAGGLYLLLYKPVKDFMDKRTAEYQALENAAREKNEQAEKLRQEYEERLREADREIAARKAEAARQAQAAAAEIEAEARAEKTHLIEQAQKAAQQEKIRILNEAGREITAMALDAVDRLEATGGKDALDDFLDRAQQGKKEE